MECYSCSSAQWYALRVRSNCEKIVSCMLKGKGYAEFLPLYRKRSKWSDRTKQIERPLFPGYVFGCFDVRNRLPILTIPGVIHVVGFGNGPEPIDEGELKSVERFVESGLAIEPWPFLKSGEPVYVERGPLAGLEGIFTSFKTSFRLVVSLTLLQRSVAVELDRDCIRPISPTRCRNAAQGFGATARPGEYKQIAVAGHGE